jgi:hypothetical protein
MTSLAGAAVALVILVDLATGQGPPVYTNYLQAQNYRGPPPGRSPASGGLYAQRVEYTKMDKDLEKAVELDKVKESPKKAHHHEKEHEKTSEVKGSYGGKKEDYESTTAAPGMFSSLSSSMSGAWSE